MVTLRVDLVYFHGSTTDAEYRHNSYWNFQCMSLVRHPPKSGPCSRWSNGDEDTAAEYAGVAAFN